MIATLKEKPIQQKRLYFKGVRLSDYALWALKNFSRKMQHRLKLIYMNFFFCLKITYIWIRIYLENNLSSNWNWSQVPSCVSLLNPRGLICTFVTNKQPWFAHPGEHRVYGSKLRMALSAPGMVFMTPTFAESCTVISTITFSGKLLINAVMSSVAGPLAKVSKLSLAWIDPLPG